MYCSGTNNIVYSLTCGGLLGIHIALGLGIGSANSPVQTSPLLATQTGQSARRLGSAAVLVKGGVEVAEQGVGQVASLGLVGDDLLLVDLARGVHTLQGTTRHLQEITQQHRFNKATSDCLGTPMTVTEFPGCRGQARRCRGCQNQPLTCENRAAVKAPTMKRVDTHEAN